MNYDIKVLGKHTPASAIPACQLYQRYIAPFRYGPLPPYHVGEKFINNGTTFFIRGKETFAATCAHCVDKFFEKREKEPNIFLSIGDFIVHDLDSRIIDKDNGLDLCTIRFTEDDLHRVGDGKSFLIWGEGSPEITKGTTVCVIGFPGQLLNPTNENHLEAGLFCVFETVKEIGTDLIIELRKDEWEMPINQSEIDLKSFNDFGGISGCPVIFQGELMPVLAGIVSEAQLMDSLIGGIVLAKKVPIFDGSGKILKGSP